MVARGGGRGPVLSRAVGTSMGVMVSGRVRRAGGGGDVFGVGLEVEEGEGDGRRGEERGRKMSGGEIEGDHRDGMGVRWWR